MAWSLLLPTGVALLLNWKINPYFSPEMLEGHCGCHKGVVTLCRVILPWLAKDLPPTASGLSEADFIRGSLTAFHRAV